MTISVIVNNGGEDLYLDPLLSSVTWSGDTQQASRKLEVSLSNTTDGRTQVFTVARGSELRFLEDGEELFRGVVFADRISLNGQYSITAYDENIYLTKSTDSKRFAGKKASDIISALCREFGIPVGTIADTGYVIPKLILRDKTLFDMMVTALTVTYHQTGRRYFLYSKGGRLQLSERKNIVANWILENGTNILDASYSTSIEEMKTKVKVVGETKDRKEIVAQVKDDTLIGKFGIMQHLENASGDVTQSQIEQLARQLLKQLAVVSDEASLNCLGIPSVYAGSAVYVREQMTGISGSYYVSADSHSWVNGLHTMSITLSATDDLPTMEYEPPPEETPSKKKTTKPKSSADPLARFEFLK